MYTKKTLADYHAESKQGIFPAISTDHLLCGEIIAHAFYPTAYNRFVTHNADFAHNVEEYQHRSKELIEHNTLLFESDDHSAIACWVPPEWDYHSYPEPLDHDFGAAEAAFKKCAEKFFKGGPFWLLTMLAKDPRKPDVKGATSKVVKPVLEDAIRRGLPCALECIDERAREIYEYYGFKTYEVVKVGEGRCNKEGYLEDGGPGLKVYYMIFNYNDPQLKPVL